MSANHPEMHTDASRKVDIICHAAQIVLENGGETYRVEETAQRMAQGLGMDHLSIAAFPTTIFIEAEERARVRRISRRGTNLSRLTLVNDVSRRVARGETDADTAEAELKQISKLPGPTLRTEVLAWGLAAGSFSLLFGGGAGTFAMAFTIGMVVQLMQPLFSDMEMGVLFGNFFGGVLTAILAEVMGAVIPYGDVNATIIGGIMPLLSGLLVTNAVRDTMYGDLISGMTRALEALLLAAFTALGVYVGLSLAAMMGGLVL